MDSWPLNEHSLARTYWSSYDDPYEVVLDYRRVQSYQQSHPDEGNYQVANALELPRGRVRGWMDNSKPDPVTAVERATEWGWFDINLNDPADPLLGAFIRLLAGIYAGGSIRSSGWVPHWTTDGPIEDIKRSLRTLDIEFRRINIQDTQRATEVVPRSGGSLLGRALHVFGGPISDKNKSSVDSLPTYLFHLPTPIRQSFVRIYLGFRQSGEQQTIKVQENRNQSYHQSLADLITTVITDPENVSVGVRGIYISMDARKELSL